MGAVLRWLLSYAGSTHALPAAAHARACLLAVHANAGQDTDTQCHTALNSPQPMARGLYCMKTWIVPLSSNMPWGSAHWQHRYTHKSGCDTTHPLRQHPAAPGPCNPLPAVKCSWQLCLEQPTDNAQGHIDNLSFEMQRIPACLPTLHLLILPGWYLSCIDTLLSQQNRCRRPSPFIHP